MRIQVLIDHFEDQIIQLVSRVGVPISSVIVALTVVRSNVIARRKLDECRSVPRADQLIIGQNAGSLRRLAELMHEQDANRA